MTLKTDEYIKHQRLFCFILRYSNEVVDDFSKLIFPVGVCEI